LLKDQQLHKFNIKLTIEMQSILNFLVTSIDNCYKYGSAIHLHVCDMVYYIDIKSITHYTSYCHLLKFSSMQISSVSEDKLEIA